MARTPKPYEPKYSEADLYAAVMAKGMLVQNFYDAIKTEWDYYREYKWKQHKFQFAMPRTEANAIETLFTKVEGQPTIGIKLINYCTGEGHEGLYLPHDTRILNAWRQEIQIPTYSAQGYHIALRDEHGFPAAASKNVSWASGVSAEAVAGYHTYISETIAWFGPLRPGNYLTETDFTQWCHQKGDFDGGYNPLDPASLALRRLQIHTDFKQSGEFNLRSFFIRQIKK